MKTTRILALIAGGLLAGCSTVTKTAAPARMLAPLRLCTSVPIIAAPPSDHADSNRKGN